MSGQTDQSRPAPRVSDAEARLAQIRALCDEREHGPGPGWIPVDEVRAVLDAAPVAATPPQAVTLTSEEASVVADLARNAARHTPSADEYRSLLDFAARLEAAL